MDAGSMVETVFGCQLGPLIWWYSRGQPMIQAKNHQLKDEAFFLDRADIWGGFF